jgi:hypothetical protein
MLESGDCEYLAELIDRMSWEQFVQLMETLNKLLSEGEENWQQ